MSKKVIARDTQQEVELDSAAAQDAVLRGDAALDAKEATQIVVKGDQIMDVPTEQLARAVDMGWKLVDEEEAAAVQMRREETDFVSGTIGAIEAGAAGASLGLSTALEGALGVDMERAQARREGLGAVGTGLELAGAVAPAVFTGGTSLAGKGAAGGIRGALKYTPAGALELAGAGLERAGVRALSGAPALVRSVVPMAGRGAVEGFVSGAGAQLHEDILGDRGLSADRILGTGGMAGLFGAGIGAAIPGVSAAALAGVKLPQAAAAKVLNRASGVLDEVSSGHLLEKALADGNAPAIAKYLGVPEESVAALLPSLRPSNKAGLAELDDLLQSGGPQRAEEALATAARQPVEDLVESVGNLRQVIGRKSKARMTPGMLNPEKLEAAITSSAGKLDEFQAAIQSGLAKNAEFGGELYEKGVLSQLERLAVKAQKQIDEVARPKTGKGAYGRDTYGAGSPEDVAAASVRALDELKQESDRIMAKVRTSAQRSGSITSSNTMDLLLGGADEAGGALTNIRKHLEDDQLLGGFGLAQKEVNSSVRDAIAARRDLADGATKRLLDGRRGFVDNRDLLSLMRSSGRFRGEQITENFRAVVRKEIEAAERVAKHYDMDADQLAALARARETESKLDELFESQKHNLDRLDAAAMFRNAEGNASVSIGSASSVGAELLERGATAAGATVGGLVAGPVGALIGGAAGRGLGYVAGLSKRPYTLLRKYTAMMRQIDKGEQGQIAAVAGFVKKMGKGAARVAKAGAPIAYGVGRGLRTGAIRKASMSAAQIRERNDKALERAQMFAGNPGALAEAVRGSTLNIEDVAPSMAGEIGNRTIVAAQFLASKAPQEWTDPLGQRKLVDKHSQARFDRYAETVLDPLTALMRMEDGTLSAEHAEALQAVYPSMYADIQKRLMNAMIEAENIPFAQRIQAGAMFNMPVDASMRPEMIATTQRALTGPSQPGPEERQMQKIRASGASEFKATSVMSGAGRIENGAGRA